CDVIRSRRFARTGSLLVIALGLLECPDGLLRPRRHRPASRQCRATDERDEIAPFHAFSSGSGHIVTASQNHVRHLPKSGCGPKMGRIMRVFVMGITSCWRNAA